ncbi:hypothetical protein Syn7502_01112 [Synechococcus sp. PCC 7502]|uniref:SMI1/KNR4 family protein n=1 Tax=Synechococcus sp. PCC 7502 TaxID=1173263 RepID=UPI00029F8EF2|nr:SMI1/KNR4 family protein [Synechococcus sp. PCC 7502]AFY73221.1 hypothetical protein Syn7502_01112 [Synechococcus sp. PCC 7502]
MPQLTPDQEAQIPYYAKKWRDIAYSTDPIDREKVTEIINRAYSLIGKKAPPIIFCGSPFDYIQKVSVFSKNYQPIDYSRLADKLNQSFSGIFQGLGELYKQAEEVNNQTEDLAQGLEGLNPKLQTLVDEVLKTSFPQVFNLDNLEPNLEQLAQESKASSQLFKQELKQSFPEFELPEELGEGLNTDLQCGNDLFFKIPAQITHELGSCIRGLLGNGREFSPMRLHNLIDRSIDSFRQNLIPRLLGNCISNISLSDNYNWCDFSISILNCKCAQERWQVSLDIVQNCGYVYPFENLCYVCDRPTKILLDENELAHALGEPAIKYPDGFKIYAYRGTLLTEKYTSVPPSEWQAEWYKEESESRLREALIEVLPSEQLQVNWLLEEENTTLRKFLMEKFGYERISAELDINDDLNILPQALQDTYGSSLWVARAILQNRVEPKIQQVIERWQELGDDFNQLRRMILIDSLERILDWYKSNVPDYQDDFLPRLTFEEIEEQVKGLPFKLPKEVYDLYQWRNGSESQTVSFDGYYFSSLEVAIENNEYINEDWNIDMRKEYNYSPYLFPVFQGDKGSYDIQVNETKVDTVPIFDDFYQEPEMTTLFNSLTTMMMAIAESYETGVYVYNPEYNSVNWEDMKKSGEIRLKYNFGTVKQIYCDGG